MRKASFSINAARAMRASGTPVADIARTLGAPYANVYAAIRYYEEKEGAPTTFPERVLAERRPVVERNDTPKPDKPRYRTPPKFDHAECVRLYLEGATIPELMQRYDVVKSCIYQIIRDARETEEQRADREARERPEPMQPIELDPFAVPMPIGKTYVTKDLFALVGRIVEQFGSQGRFARASGLSETDVSRLVTGLSVPAKALDVLGLEWRAYKAAFEQVRPPTVYQRDAIVVALEAQIAELKATKGGKFVKRAPRVDDPRVASFRAENEALRRRLANAEAMIPAFAVRVRLKAVA